VTTAGPGFYTPYARLDVRVSDLRSALRRWSRDPASVLARWAVGSLLLGLALLGAALLVATVTVPGGDTYVPTFADPAAGVSDAVQIFARNSLVLALHSLVCVAVYMATRPAPPRATRLQRSTGPVALCVIGGLTIFSLASQTWTLGHQLAGAAQTLGVSNLGLVERLSVHAVPELTALFLPLAACLALVRGARHDDLGAAGLVCFAAALPVVALCACLEVFVTRYVV
jgi:hypothetical protein